MPTLAEPPRRGWRKWLPTAKWWGATITAAATIVTLLWTGDGINTDEEKTLVIGLVASRVLAYAIPKDQEV